VRFHSVPSKYIDSSLYIRLAFPLFVVDARGVNKLLKRENQGSGFYTSYGCSVYIFFSTSHYVQLSERIAAYENRRITQIRIFLMTFISRGREIWERWAVTDIIQYIVSYDEWNYQQDLEKPSHSTPRVWLQLH